MQHIQEGTEIYTQSTEMVGKDPVRRDKGNYFLYLSNTWKGELPYIVSFSDVIS
jgi:hypothetical protein